MFFFWHCLITSILFLHRDEKKPSEFTNHSPCCLKIQILLKYVSIIHMSYPNDSLIDYKTLLFLSAKGHSETCPRVIEVICNGLACWQMFRHVHYLRDFWVPKFTQFLQQPLLPIRVLNRINCIPAHNIQPEQGQWWKSQCSAKKEL